MSSAFSSSFPLLEDFLMKRVIIVSFSATTPVAADMYCDMNNITGGGRR